MKNRTYLILLVLFCIAIQTFTGCNDQKIDSTPSNSECRFHVAYSLEEFYEDLITLTNNGQINDAIGSTEGWKHDIAHSDGTACSKIELLVPIANPDKYVIQNVWPMGNTIMYYYDLIGAEPYSKPIIVYVSRTKNSDIEEAPAEYDEKEKLWKLTHKNYNISIAVATTDDSIQKPSDVTNTFAFEYKVLQECDICKKVNFNE